MTGNTNSKSRLKSLGAAGFWILLLVGILVFKWKTDPFERDFAVIVIPEIAMAIVVSAVVGAIALRSKSKQVPKKEINPLVIIKK